MIYTQYRPQKDDVQQIMLTGRHGGVSMVAVDQNGEELPGGVIATLYEQGELVLHKNCTAKGIKREGAGYIMTRGEALGCECNPKTPRIVFSA